MQPTNFTLNIGIIRIAMVENTSAVNIGQNLLLDWDSHSKTNQGLGNISGDSNNMDHPFNNLEDPDKIDLLCQEESGTITTGELNQLVKSFFGEGSQ